MYIQCKLDRCFGNKEWRRVFCRASLEFMEKLGSDHRPVMVDLACENGRRRGTFCVDKRMVGKCRVHRNENTSLLDRIGVTRQFLSKWKRESNQNSNVRMVKLRHDLETATSSTPSDFVLIQELK